MSANYDGALAHLFQEMSTTREGLERCFASIELLIRRVSQIERTQTASGKGSERTAASLTKLIGLGAVDAIDTAGVAALLGCSRAHATSRITKMYGFPKPVINLSQKTKAWDRDEVLAFVKKRPRRRR